MEILKDKPGYPNNTLLICKKAAELKNILGEIVECGVFKGSTIFPVAEFCKNEGIAKKIYGFDTFGGFPDGQIHEFDHPKYFKTLLDQGLISKEHFDKASLRTKGFTDTSHLTKEYFLNVEEVFETAKKFPNITLVRGVFSETLPKFKQPIALLYIDCDLYQSYMDCLKILYGQVSLGGAIILDEYYSLKYPGARVAVNEFFKDKDGHFEVYNTSEGFERWCFMKNK